MGGGSYSFSARTTRATEDGFYTKSTADLFTQSNEQKAHPDMLVHNKIRESRDSEEHPTSIPIIIALDVTGSMLSIPVEFIRDGMPGLMSKLMEAGIEHPQVCFAAVGDHESDRFPFQAGQFESSDELIDKWLRLVYLEGNGGGNGGESYGLAWKFAASHTAIDSFAKRGQKGFLFTIGDEPNLRTYPGRVLNNLFGGENSDETDQSLFDKASLTWNLNHIFFEHGSRSIDGRWKEMFGEDVSIVTNHMEIARKIADIIIHKLGLNLPTSKPTTQLSKPEFTGTPEVKITL